MDMVIYVIGFIGSDRTAAARAASEQYGIPLYDLAAEIEARDGRGIRRMVITMGEHELRNKEYETLTAILKECSEPTDLSETAADPDLPVICKRSAAAGCEEPATPAYTAVICCTDDLVLDPMSADLVRAGKVIIADDPEAADSAAQKDALLRSMLERAMADDTTHYAFLMDPDKEKVREKFYNLYEQRRPLYESFRK